MKCSLPSVHEALRDEFVKLSGTDSPWVIDSGATHNLACNKHFVTGYAPQESGSLDKETGEENKDVEFADGNSAPLDGQGVKSFEMCSIGTTHVCEAMQLNLVSVKQLTRQGYIVLFADNFCLTLSGTNNTNNHFYQIALLGLQTLITLTYTQF